VKSVSPVSSVSAPENGKSVSADVEDVNYAKTSS